VGTPPLQRTSAQATPHRPVSARTTKKRNQATSRFQTRRLLFALMLRSLRPCHGKSTRLGACGVGGWKEGLFDQPVRVAAPSLPPV